jgi:serine/threonine-protein kinase RsbW
MAPPVRLQLPPESQYLRLARLTAASLATDLDFDLEQIDDLKIAVDELCAVLLDDAAGLLDLAFSLNGSAIVVEGRCPSASIRPIELHPIAEELLGIVADDFRLELSDSQRTFRLECARRAE